MAAFLTGTELNEFIYDVIWNAKERLLIVSPFIKLDDYFKKIFEQHKHNHNLDITIVFGKNLASPNKSLRESDFDFLKQFKNIAIVYCSDLHAKYYGNERTGVITSINLYDKSFEKNIEYGVGYEVDFLSQFQTSADKRAWEFSFDLADKSPLVFLKRPVYESGLLTAITGKKNYIDAEVMYDATNIISSNYKWEKEKKRFLNEFDKALDINDRKRERPAKPVKEEAAASKKHEAKPQTGYCIRTRVEIPFDINKPMCYEAYKSWAKFGNYDFKENYCHKTGKPSYGKTSMRMPILYQ